MPTTRYLNKRVQKHVLTERKSVIKIVTCDVGGCTNKDREMDDILN